MDTLLITGLISVAVIVGLIIWVIFWFFGKKDALMMSYFGRKSLAGYTTVIGLEKLGKMLIFSQPDSERVVTIQEDQLSLEAYADVAKNLTLERLENLVNEHMSSFQVDDTPFQHSGTLRVNIFNQVYPAFKVIYPCHNDAALVTRFLYPNNRLITITVNTPEVVSEEPEDSYYQGHKADMEKLIAQTQFDPQLVALFQKE